MSGEGNSGVFSRRKDNERRVPVAILPLPPKEKQVRKQLKNVTGNSGV